MNLHWQKHPWWHLLALGSMALLILVLVGCGGGVSTSSTGSSASMASAPQASNAQSLNASSKAKLSPSDARVPADTGPRYLIKTLKVDMQVKDTRRVADELQTWISDNDPLATSAGTDYQQSGNNLYNVSMTFAVQASIYPRIQRYLRDYASSHSGQLMDMNETVQDVTNSYVDTQSRLTTLKTEQGRLLNLMSHANALGEVIAIEQRLTDVEQQLESTQSQLKTLNSQVSFYTVTIALEPIVAAPQPGNPIWNVGQVFHDAFAASLSFAQGLLTFLIWLLAFSVYIVPPVIIVWLVVHNRNRFPRFPAPKAPVMTPPSAN